MKRFLMLPLITVCLIAVIKIGEMAAGAKIDAVDTTSEYVAVEVVETETETESTSPIVIISESEYVESIEETPSYSEDELYVLAHLICGEAQGYSDELQQAVGSVVLNRVNDSAYPDTIEGVVFQKGQYACTWDGNYDREPTERNWANAKYLLENGSQLPPEVVYQAQFKQGSGVYKQIQNEYFCYK